ncbi:MAG: SIS domain-containing protein [Verrucomicrobiaceae bacterium]|nr:MAG: SIS domain-containing protein [Verrucomicrobiaceae bacterium]
MSESPHPFEEYLTRLRTALDSLCRESMDAAVDALMACYHAGGSVYVMGNGGSASTATHMACDLSKGPTPPGRQGLVVWSLTDNPALLTAIANDLAYDEIFAQPILSRMRSNDVLIAVSASGNSPNLIKGIKAARQKGCRIIALTGFHGGYLKDNSDIVLHATESTYGPVEDAHLIINHYFVEAVKNRLATEARPL